MGVFRGWGVRVHKFKSLGKLSNGCTDWHQIWYTSADSSGNGYRLNTIRPTIPQGHFGGFLGGHKFFFFGKLSNGWTDWHQIWYKSADSSGNGHKLNVLGSCQTAAPIGTKFGTRRRIRLGMDIG